MIIFRIVKIGKYLKKIFNNNSEKLNNSKNKEIILVEDFFYYPSLIGYAYFLKVLNLQNSSKILSYNSSYLSFIKIIIAKLKKIYFFFDYFQKSIGIEGNLYIEKIINEKKILQDLKKIKINLKTKHDVLHIRYLGMNIGHEIYDEYLRVNNKNEVDLIDKNFDKCLREMIILLNYWNNFFIKRKVKAVLISHAVYFKALIMRVAFKFNVPVYVVGAQNFFLLTKKNDSKNSCCGLFKKSFKKLKFTDKQMAINEGKVKLMSRFDGKVDVKLLQDQKMDFNLFQKNKKKYDLKINKSKINILVAAHCFTDAVHAYGKSFYTDFKDWIVFLCKAANLRGYNIFIKIHPAQYKNNLHHFKNLQKNYSFKLLPNDITFDYIVKQPFDYATTVYGSIGHEYPIFKIPVINASNNGPHSSYGFNINAKNKQNYEKIILNLKKKQFEISKKKIYEISQFYFMRYLSEYAFLDNWHKYMNILGKEYNSYKILQMFCKNFKQINHSRKLEDLNKFIKLKKIRCVADNTKGISKLIGFIN